MDFETLQIVKYFKRGKKGKNPKTSDIGSELRGIGDTEIKEGTLLH
jgi:hypothetical protein